MLKPREMAYLVSTKGFSQASHAIFILQVHLLTSPCPTLSAHTEPTQGHEAESLTTHTCVIGW